MEAQDVVRRPKGGALRFLYPKLQPGEHRKPEGAARHAPQEAGAGDPLVAYVRKQTSVGPDLPSGARSNDQIMDRFLPSPPVLGSNGAKIRSMEPPLDGLATSLRPID